MGAEAPHPCRLSAAREDGFSKDDERAFFYAVRIENGTFVLFFVPFFLPPLLDVSAGGLAVIPDAPAQYSINAPHPGYHVPAQGAGTVEIVTAAFCPFRLDVEHIAHADGP